MPIVCGWRSPTIVVPTSLVDRDRGLALAILGHECAHIARRDLAKNLILELVLAPLIFHPAVAALKRIATQYREMSCDELAIERLGLVRTMYARSLLRMAAVSQDPSHPAAFAMRAINGRRLENRVKAILMPPRPHRLASFRWALTATSLSLAALMTPVYNVASHAQDAADISGVWTLVPGESDPANALPFAAVTLRISLDGLRIHVEQQRTKRDGVSEVVGFLASMDGTPFLLVMPNGQPVTAAVRRNSGRLTAEARLPGTDNIEHDQLFLRNGRLVVTMRRVHERVVRRIEFVFKKSG